LVQTIDRKIAAAGICTDERDRGHFHPPVRRSPGGPHDQLDPCQKSRRSCRAAHCIDPVHGADGLGGHASRGRLGHAGDLAGSHYSGLQLAKTAKQGGFSGNGWVISVAVSLAESQGRTKAVLVNTDCSHDRGLWQISNRWHAEVSDAQSVDPVSCAKAAHTISSGGSNWQPWTTYLNGAYQQFMSRAQAAVKQAGG